MKIYPPHRRQELLAKFDKSGMSSADFARHHQIAYSTFCAWRHRRPKGQPRMGFVELDVVPREELGESIVIELSSQARLRLSSAAQVPLAVELLQHLQKPC